MKRQIDNSIKMTDGTFGITLHLWEKIPKWCNSILVTVRNGEEIISQRILLPHQLYLDDLEEISHNRKYDVIITPQYPIVKSFSIFKSDEDVERSLASQEIK